MRRVLAFICVIFVIVCFVILQVFKIPLPDFSAWDGKTVEIVGTLVHKEWRSNEHGESLMLLLSPLPLGAGDARTEADAPEISGKVMCYINDVHDFEPRLGATIMVSGRLKAFERASNPGQFCAASYYQILKYDFRLYNAQVVAQSAQYSRFREGLYGMKMAMGQAAEGFFTPDKASVMRTMLLGDSAGMDAEIKALYQRNGIIHILSISGLHISIIGLGAYKILRRMWVPPIIAALFCVALMYCYGIMINMGPSSFRAIIMFTLRLAAGLLRRTYDLLTALAVAAVLILVDQPLYLFHAGFLFSFCAVLAIGLFLPAMFYRERKKEKKPPPGIRAWPYKAKDAFLGCLLISSVTFPIYLYFYYEFPLFSVILNLLVIPPMTMVMIGGIITMTVGMIIRPLGYAAAFISSLILDFYDFVCRVGDRLPINRLVLGKPPSISILIFCALLVLIIALHKKIVPALRYGLWALAITVLLIRLPGDLTVGFLDVGQGDAIHIAVGGRHYMVDGGSSSVQAVGEYRILPYLKSQGAGYIDAWFISHPHADHYSGFLEIAGNMDSGGVQIGSLVLPQISEEMKDESYYQLEEAAKQAGIKLCYLSRSQRFFLDKKEEIAIQCLHPASSDAWSDPNDYSAVLHLSYADFSLLLTGDIGQNAEAQIMDYMEAEAIGAVKVLKVAHHGSKNSSDGPFVTLLSPDYAIIQAGVKNRYGHPHAEALDRLENSGAKVYITYESGAVIIETDGLGMSLTQFSSRSSPGP